MGGGRQGEQGAIASQSIDNILTVGLTIETTSGLQIGAHSPDRHSRTRACTRARSDRSFGLHIQI